MTEQMKAALAAFLKENLTISIEMDSEPEGYCSSRSINVAVSIHLGEELISQAHDYATIPDK